MTFIIAQTSLMNQSENESTFIHYDGFRKELIMGYEKDRTDVVHQDFNPGAPVGNPIKTQVVAPLPVKGFCR